MFVIVYYVSLTLLYVTITLSFWYGFMLLYLPTQSVLPITNGPSVSLSSPNSPSHNMNDFQSSLFYQFLAMDVASAIDYSKDLKVTDGVLENPLAKVVNLTYAMSPSSLCKKKRALIAVETHRHLEMMKTLIKGPTCVSTWRLPHVTFS